MRFFQEDEGFDDEIPVDTRLSYTPLLHSPTPSDTFLNQINDTFTFSDVTCLACLCLVPVFGISGLVLGFALPIYLADYMNENLSNDQILMVSMLPPLLGLFLCMLLGFLVWGKSIEWASNWETGAAQRRGPGLALACQEFLLANPCLIEINARVKSLIESNQSGEQSAIVERGVSLV